jgi:hypothetical protein
MPKIISDLPKFAPMFVEQPHPTSGKGKILQGVRKNEKRESLKFDPLVEKKKEEAEVRANKGSWVEENYEYQTINIGSYKPKDVPVFVGNALKNVAKYVTIGQDDPLNNQPAPMFGGFIEKPNPRPSYTINRHQDTSQHTAAQFYDQLPPNLPAFS